MKEDMIADLENSLKSLRSAFDLSVSKPADVTIGESHQYIAFRLSQEQYAWPVSHAQKIIAKKKIIPIPGFHDSLGGVINYKNQIFSVTDLYKILKMPSGGDDGSSGIIVTKGLTIDTAIRVKSFAGIINVEKKMIQPKPLSIDKEVAVYLTGEIYHQNSLITLLNPDHFSG